jgi:hypothetical protein
MVTVDFRIIIVWDRRFWFIQLWIVAFVGYIPRISDSPKNSIDSIRKLKKRINQIFYFFVE